MIPLRVTAQLWAGVLMPDRPIALDGLLGYAAWLRTGLPPAQTPDEIVDLEIPLQKDPTGRFYLASFGMCEMEKHVVRYVNRRAPIEQMQMWGLRMSLTLSAGANKSYRIPHYVARLVDDRLTWWCVGDEAQVRDLLRDVSYLGKKRAVGLGRVKSWHVEPTEPWEGFPVLLDGRPLRTLPADYPGIEAECELSVDRLTPPYWLPVGRELCAVP